MIKLSFKSYTPYRSKELLRFFSKLSKKTRTLYSLGGIDPKTLNSNFKFGWTLDHLVLAYQGKELVGVVKGISLDTNVMMISGLVVAEEWQRKGIGTRILKYLIALAILDGIEKTVLEVIKKNKEALKFWKKMGFRLTVEKDLVFCLEKEI